MIRTVRESIWIFAIAAVMAGGAALLHPKAPSWFVVREASRWDLRVEAIRETLGADYERVFWIDSRKDEQFEKGHIEGALLLNRESWIEQITGNQDRLEEALGRPVVVYCDGRGCERSKEIAERLRQLIGLDPVYVLRGDWRKLPGFGEPAE